MNNRSIRIDSAEQPDYIPNPQTDPIGYDAGRRAQPAQRRGRVPFGAFLLGALALLGGGLYMGIRLSNWLSSEYASNSTFSTLVLYCLYAVVLALALGFVGTIALLLFGLFGRMARAGLVDVPGGFMVHTLDLLTGWRRADVRLLASDTMQQHFGVQQTLAQQSQYRNVTAYSPTINTSYNNRQDAAALDSGEHMPALLLPPHGPIDLASIGHTPTPQSVLLGIDETGAPVTVPMGKLWHVATAGPTGNGKSNIHRLLLGQLLAMGAHVVIADPKFTRFDMEQDEDWRPIADRLHLAPAVDAAQIGALFDWAQTELQQRLERRRNQQKAGPPLFFTLDELPWIADNVKGSADALGELVRLGRGVGMYTLAAAQDFLVKTVSLSAARDNFRTGFYLGGDLKTGSVLLDMPQRDLSALEHQLGVGLALVRSAATAPPRVLRVPYVSNESLYALLEGHETSRETKADSGFQMGFKTPAMKPTRNPNETQHETRFHSAPMPQTHDAKTARILALFQEGKSIGEIVKAVYEVASGPKYNEARAEVEKIIRAALVGA